MSREQCQPLCPLNSHYVSQKDCFQVLVMMCNGVELDADEVPAMSYLISREGLLISQFRTQGLPINTFYQFWG